MKFTIILVALLITGCATFVDPDVEKSLSRDKTMEKIAKTALITEMLNSPDPVIRAKAADIADKFLTEPKKNILGF
jgi:PBP1b-binding outer membrane lipoprotein LpoB